MEKWDLLLPTNENSRSHFFHVDLIHSFLKHYWLFPLPILSFSLPLPPITLPAPLLVFWFTGKDNMYDFFCFCIPLAFWFMSRYINSVDHWYLHTWFVHVYSLLNNAIHTEKNSFLKRWFWGMKYERHNSWLESKLHSDFFHIHKYIQ